MYTALYRVEKESITTMYEALYRKYRPKSLNDLVGQEEAVSLIEKQIKQETLNHAYLFSGPRGVGKTSLARIIAVELGCDPVFDITEIDAASNNKVDDIRELNESINFIASSPGKKRVFILDEVHMLSNAASNAFLKTLEEPPQHIVFILATTEPDRVLDTIKSRTTHIVFKKIATETIVNSLQKIGKEEGTILENEILEYIAIESDGSLRDAINLFEQAFSTFGSKASLDDIDTILGKVASKDLMTIIKSISTQDTAEVLSVIKKNYNKGLQPLDILGSLSNLFRNIFYFKYLPEDSTFLDISSHERELVKDANEFINAKELTKILDMLDEVNQNIKTAPSQELKLELFLLKIVKPQLSTDIKSVSRRLDILENEPNVVKKKEVKEVLESEVKKEENIVEENEIEKKGDVGDFDVFWPKILQEAKLNLTPRKYSYLTLVKPLVDEDNNLYLYVDEDNEYLISELQKSQDIKDFIEDKFFDFMNVETSVLIKTQKNSGKNTDTKSYQENIADIFE